LIVDRATTDSPAAFAEGVRGRLATLYQRHADSTARLAYLLTGDRTLAEDLMQEAFVRSAKRLAHLRDPDSFDAYLRRAVVNLARSHFRRRRLEREYLLRHAAGGDSTTEPEVDPYPSLKGALLTLPPRQREAVVLRFYEDLSERQTADVMRVRPGTVKALVAQAMASLRDTVTREGGRSDD
jgi:RNA polymerase sigma-70 factor (sigma-E family)